VFSAVLNVRSKHKTQAFIDYAKSQIEDCYFYHSLENKEDKETCVEEEEDDCCERFTG
jgi:hypothetical protein